MLSPTRAIGIALAVALAAGSARAQCETETLTAFDKLPNDGLGWRVAFQTETLVSSAPLCDNSIGQDTGAVYTWFLDIGGAWVQGPKVAPVLGLSSPHDRFGNTLSLDGDVMAVGTMEGFVPLGAGPTGSVFVYARNASGWTYQQRLVSTDLAAEDGLSLGLTNRAGTIWAGAPGADLPGAPNAGAVYRFDRAGNVWSQAQKLTHTIQANAGFGSAVSTDGTYLVVGAPLFDQPGKPDAGAAFLFKYVAGSWQFQQQLNPADPTQNARFGSSVSVYSTRIAVGADPVGAAGYVPGMYMFAYDGVQWSQEAKLEGDAAGDAGEAVSTSQVNAITSGLGFVNGLPVNTHRFYRREGTSWIREGQVSLPLGAPNGGYANSVAVSDGYYMLGNPNLHPSAVSWAGGVQARAIDLHSGADDISEARTIVSYFQGCTSAATVDGEASCGNSNSTPDVWYRFTAAAAGAVEISTIDSVYDTVLSVYSAPIGDTAHQIACNDDFASPARWSKVGVTLAKNQQVWIRVSGYQGATGPYTIRVSAACYANCDASLTSPALNVNDFSCFLNKYAASDAYANCDGSTSAPVLNVNDFSCFLNKFATGCP